MTTLVKYKGEEYNGRNNETEGRNREQSIGRGRLANHYEGSPKVSETNRRRSDTGRSGGEKNQTNNGPQVRYEDLTDYQRAKAGTLIFPIISSDPEACPQGTLLGMEGHFQTIAVSQNKKERGKWRNRKSI